MARGPRAATFPSVIPRSVSEYVSDPRRAGRLDGAAALGEAAGGERLVVRVGLWLDRAGRVVRARYRATTCATLIAYAEAACALAEAGEAPARLGADRIRAAVGGVHPCHHDRAELVAVALARAAAALDPRPGASP